MKPSSFKKVHTEIFERKMIKRNKMTGLGEKKSCIFNLK